MDAAGQVVYAGPNADLRAVFQGAAIDEEMGDRVYRTTGHTPSFMLAPAKLEWFRLQRPELHARIARVLTLADWLVWKLTGILATETTLATEAGLLDVTSRRWRAALLDGMESLNDGVPLVESGTLVGPVGRDASLETGLTPGTPVAVGGADSQCGLLGMGVVHEHQVGIVAGWSAAIQMVTARPVFSPEGKTWAGRHLEAETWVLESSAGDVGNSYRWLANMLFEGCSDAWARMDELADAAPRGSQGALAFLGQSRMDMSSLGMTQGGFLFPVALTFATMGRSDLIRASIESAAYAIRANIEQIEDLAEHPTTDLMLGGGMTGTRTFVRVLADVLGREIGVAPTPQVSATGAYLCACTAMGEFSSLTEAAASVTEGLEDIEPVPVAAAEYQDHYEQWMQVSGRLREISL